MVSSRSSLSEELGSSLSGQLMKDAEDIVTAKSEDVSGGCRMEDAISGFQVTVDQSSVSHKSS